MYQPINLLDNNLYLTFCIAQRSSPELNKVCEGGENRSKQ